MKTLLKPDLAGKHLFKLLIGAVVVQIITALTLSGLHHLKTEREISRRIGEISVLTQSAITLPVWFFNTDSIQYFVDNLLKSDEVVYVRVKSGGETVYHATDIAYRGKSIHYFNQRDRFDSAKISLDHNGNTIGTIQLFIDREIFEKSNSEYFLVIFGITTILLFTLPFLSLFFVRRNIVRPLHLLNENFPVGDTVTGNNGMDANEIDTLQVKITSLLDKLENLEGKLNISDSPSSLNHNFKKEILEHHETMLQLNRSEQKFNYILRNSPEILYTINLKSKQFEYISPACERILGYPPEELIKQGPEEMLNYFHPDDIPIQKNALLKQISGGSVDDSMATETQYQFLHKSKGFRYLSDTRSVIFDGHEKPLRIVGSIRDITEEKKTHEENRRIQKKLQQSQKMEAIGTLAGGIAHDFNNILGAILGYADMAQEEVARGSSVDHDLQEIIRAGDRAKELVRQILAYSRKEAQQQINVNIPSIIKEVYKLLRASIPSNIGISMDIDPNCGSVMAEPTQIHQVLMNLCTNAAHAVEHKQEGCIHIELSRKSGYGLKTKKVSLPPGNSYLVLRIKDNGKGIPEKIQDRIFDPYFTTKKIGEGSGMGLTVVAGIVKSHGGTITVESNQESGTVFTVFLPETKGRYELKKEKKKILTRGSGNILLVDDEKAMVNITGRRLERLGYTIKSFTSSRKALEEFSRNTGEYDLVITDQTMPDLTGDQLTSAILKIQPDCPVIICSGFSEKIDAEKAVQLGARFFLLKPVDKYELADAVNNLLAEKIDKSQSF